MIDGRLSELGLHDCSSYVAYLADGEKGSAEMEILIAQLMIGETYFFRDEAQFAAIRDVILPDILERNKSRQLRIWSAGCSTGAEPYSLAILLAQQLGDRISDWQISIHATDLNRGYLSEAAEGKFRAWALRSTSDDIKRDCFSNDGSVWSIHSSIQAVDFISPFEPGRQPILHSIGRGYSFRSDSVPQRHDLLHTGGQQPADRTISSISGGCRLAGSGRVGT